MNFGARFLKVSRSVPRMPLPEERKQREQRSVSGYIAFLSIIYLLNVFIPDGSLATMLFLLANGVGLLGQVVLSALSRSLRVTASIALIQGIFVAVSFLPGRALSAAVITGAVSTGIVVGTLFFVAGTVGATLMGLADMQRWESRRKRMSRHQRIGVLLDLKDRISVASLRGEPDAQSNWTDKIGRNLFGWAFGLGFGLDVSFVIIASLLLRTGYAMSSLNEPTVAIVFLYSLSFLGIFGANLLIGYCSGRFPRMLAATVLLTASGSSFMIWPGHPTYQLAQFGMNRDMFWQGVGISMLISTVGWLAAYVQRKTERIWKLQRGDASVLNEEIQRLENSLLRDQSRKCVVAVDVVGSTRMKANADMLVSEWCFREYQQIVTQCVEDEGGQVVNTAGDGVVASFEDPACALEAAAAVRDRLLVFNARGNRLSEPFQVRIGIDSAEVQGNLAEVQFSQLIDTAAHIEAMTPAGAIGVSQSFMALLPSERATQHGYSADGKPIFLMRESGSALWAEPLPTSS